MPSQFLSRQRPRYQLAGGTDQNTIIPGGEVVQLKASGTLKIGDVVYVSAARTVAISNNAANHDKVLGVVVGGQVVGMAVIDDSNFVGTNAALDGQQVLVLVRGVAYVTTAAAIAAGVALVADTTTAGRVKAMTALTIAAGATPVTSSAANGAIISGEGSDRIVGRMIDATAGVAAGLALINTT